MPATPSRKARNARAAQRLEQIPNVGQSIAQDLRDIGIKTSHDLIGRDPQRLYERLCRRTRARQDPCVLDTFTSAVRFMEGKPARPWWHYTPERKKKATSPAAADGHVVCETPTPGKTAKRIDRWKYDIVRKAILASLPKGGPGILFSELPSRVAQRLSPGERHRLGSVSWYTATVKLALEVKGEIIRVKGAVPQRLLRITNRPSKPRTVSLSKAPARAHPRLVRSD